MGTEVAYRSAVELADDIAGHHVSPVEIMEETLRQVDLREPSLNAIVFRGFDEAMESARSAEKTLAKGESGGPLLGVPVLMKDLFDFKPGWPATFGGIRAMSDFSIDGYCVWAERMEAAGAIIIGKGNSPAMGFRGACDNYLFGPTRNPFDTTRNSGGSSGGSAAAVADGLVPIAEGTDGGGSIRIPASWCGVVGYQPSAGRVALDPQTERILGCLPLHLRGPDHEDRGGCRPGDECDRRTASGRSVLRPRHGRFHVRSRPGNRRVEHRRPARSWRVSGAARGSGRRRGGRSGFRGCRRSGGRGRHRDRHRPAGVGRLVVPSHHAAQPRCVCQPGCWRDRPPGRAPFGSST